MKLTQKQITRIIRTSLENHYRSDGSLIFSESETYPQGWVNAHGSFIFGENCWEKIKEKCPNIYKGLLKFATNIYNSMPETYEEYSLLMDGFIHMQQTEEDKWYKVTEIFLCNLKGKEREWVLQEKEDLYENIQGVNYIMEKPEKTYLEGASKTFD